jgi:taurine dioxygenase
MTLVSNTKITVRPLTGWTGAEIHGVDLSQPLDPQVVSEIRETLLKWKVVFFRDQHLGHREHVAFARSFGKVTPAHPLFDAISDPEFPEVYPVQRDRFKIRYVDDRDVDNAWHTDVTAAVNPPAASILRSDIVPPYGGDTQFSNTVAVYEGLSDSFRSYIDTLRARHQFTLGEDATDDYRARFTRRPLLSEHPVVRVHPETGERSLFVNRSFTKNIVGVTPRESKRLLELLYEEISRPRYTVRFKWEPGSVAFWDNRATVHLGPTDIDHLDFDRSFYRITLEGDVPVGPDGRSSIAIEGDPFLAAEAIKNN